MWTDLFTVLGVVVTVCVGFYGLTRLTAFCEGREW